MAIGIVAAGVGFATGATLIGAAVGLVLSIATSALLRPSTPSLNQSSGSVSTPTLSSYTTSIPLNQSSAPMRVVYGYAKVSGIWSFLQTADNNQLLYYDMLLAGHNIHGVNYVWIGDTPLGQNLDNWPAGGTVTTTQYKGSAFFEFHFGEDDQTAPFVLVQNLPDYFTADHRLRGIAHVAGNFFWDVFGGDGTIGQKLWAGSALPAIAFEIFGHNQVYDPRTNTTGYHFNSALCLAEYLTNKVYGRGADWSTIDYDSLIAAANICDELVTNADGSQLNRYATNGSFTCDQSPDSIIESLLLAMQGTLVRTNGKWYIYAGAWIEPTITLTDDDMRAPSQLSVMGSGRDVFNGVRGTYHGADTQWADQDFGGVQSAALVAADNNVETWTETDFPFTIYAPACQRLAKIALLDARQEIVETFHGKFTALRALTRATIFRDSERYGWNQKPFQVKKITMTADQDSTGAPMIGFDLVLKETDASIWDWNTSEEVAIDPAPNTTLPTTSPLVPQGPLTAVETLYLTRSNNTSFKSQIDFAWQESVDAFVRIGGGYILRWRLVGATKWTTTPIIYTTSYSAPDVAPGFYEAELYGVSWFGERSADNLSVTFEVYGLTTPPADPNNLEVTPIAGGVIARLILDESPDIDVRYGGLLYLRHAPVFSGATWEGATPLTKPQPGDTRELLVPLKAGAYLAKYQDAGGNWSPGFAVFYQSQQSMFDFSTLASIEEDPDFAGAKTDVYTADGVLALAPTTDFDSVTSVDALASWDFYTTVEATGTYDFHATMDFGAVSHVRLTSILSAFIENVLDFVDSRSGDVDTWPSWDGDVSGNEGTVTLWYRTTLDNPAGAPTWTAWQQFLVVEATARACQFRATLDSNDAAYSPIVSALGVVAEEVA